MLFGLLISLGFASDYLITNIRIIDGSGDQGIHSVRISGDRIAEIDPDPVAKETVTYDGEGKTLLPGLIDSHVHITMIPGEPFRSDSSDQRKQRHAQDLQSYLAWGVTTIVDPGITIEDVELIKELTEKGPSPAFHVIGPLLGPEHGYPSVITKFEGISSKEEVIQRLDEYAFLQPIGVKITMEDGHMGSIWPLLDEDMRSFISEQCDSRNQPKYIHAMDAKMTRAALQMQPHALVHASKNGGRRLAREIAEQNVYVVTTLDIYGSPLIQWNRSMLSHPNIAFTVPSDAIDLIYDPDTIKKSKDVFLTVNAPWLPLWISQRMMNQRSYKAMLKQASTMIGHLNQEGVQLVLGSDSGGWPILTFMLHGPTTHLEIDLLFEAGLSAQDIITASTQRPAKMLGLENEVGSIKEGLRADLLIVEGNPLEDISVIHNPVWVVRAGEIRTPKEWMFNSK